jgi:tight adherence protein C
MPVLIAVLTFSAVSLVAWEIFRPKEEVVRRRVLAGLPIELASERRLEGGIGSRLLGPTAQRVGRVLARLLPHNFLARLELMLIQANSKMSLPQFLIVWAVMAGIGAVTLFVGVRSITAPFQMVMIGFGIGSVFFLGPYLMLSRSVKKRKKAITRSLPYALDLLVTCVQAGQGVDAAVATVTERTSGPISQAFALYLKEVGLGRPRREALAQMSLRTGVLDLDRLAASVIQAEEMGVAIGDALTRLAVELRIIRRQRAEMAAQRAPVLMTIPLATCFTPAMFAVVVVPSFVNFYNFVGKIGLPRG